MYKFGNKLTINQYGVLRFGNKMLFQKTPNKSIDRSKHKIWFLDAPEYGNLGDQAIAFAITKFCNKILPDRQMIEFQESNVLSYIHWIKKNINKKDIIVLQGGGNLGNLYPRYEFVRRMIVKNFPENKIIIFPQSISYSNDDKGKYESIAAQRIYSAHQHLTIFARDTSSYKMMRKILHNVDIRLCPDIVFSLRDIVQSEKRQGVGMCIRNDKESCLSDEDKNLLMEQVEQKYSRINNFSTTITSEKDIFGEERRKLVLSKLQEISQFELVITDRLHGMIFAYITSTPCIALNNTTGKSYFAYRDWLSDKENVVFLNDKFELDDLPKSMHSVEMNFDTLKNCLTSDM